jgi:ComF family protein
LVYKLLKKLFVESCPACGGPSGSGFCASCVTEFGRVPNACPRCGLARPVAHCPREQAPWHIDAMVAPFTYAAPLDHYVHALKYRGGRPLGRAFGLLLSPSAGPLSSAVDALVAVPLHGVRLRERGYNQALEVARALSRELRLPVLEHGIKRIDPTASQTGQGARERRASMLRAFRVERALAGQRIAIVDDVVTTGATVNALAAELRMAGADSCCVFAVARTPEPAQGRKV